MSFEERIFPGDGDGWIHLGRMARHKREGTELPEETIAYFVELSQSLIDRKLELIEEEANRKRSRRALLATSLSHLQVTPKDRGKGNNLRKNIEELQGTTEWQHAMAVYEYLAVNPSRSIEDVFAQVGEDYGGNNHATDISVVRKAWRNLRHMVIGSVSTGT